MTLSTRLWLYGAAVPVVVLSLALVATDQIFHLAQERGLDRALLAQAAVESVSLFDSPDREVQLHMATSPLVESVRPFAPEGVLFGPDGQEETRYPPKVDAPTETLPPLSTRDQAVLDTVQQGGERLRRLTVTVLSPKGKPYTLRLIASMAQLDHAALAFHQVSLVAVAVAALFLVTLQRFEGRKLRRRLEELHHHLEAVQAGHLERALPLELEKDEVAELRRVLAAATAALEAARARQERLLADAAHELRTPLTLMRTSLDLALRRERSAPELRQALQDAHEEVVRLGDLATRLLDAVSMGKGELEMEEANLSELAQEAVAAARASALAKGLLVTLEAPAEAKARVHPGAVRQALDNLLSNAIRFAPNGSTVTVRLENGPGGHVVSVHDDGPGIPPSEREAVFEAFHRVQGAAPAAKSTGLGLTIVREVARHHGGRAYVADAPRGTTVRIELP